jgi:hypothetical protein
MMRQVFIPAFAALVALGIACANAPPPPAKPPPAERETRLEPPRRPAHHGPPRIQAPPPAYGNKIVMASTPAVSSEF